MKIEQGNSPAVELELQQIVYEKCKEMYQDNRELIIKKTENHREILEILNTQIKTLNKKVFELEITMQDLKNKLITLYIALFTVFILCLVNMF